jgi:dolichol-phosphate mannosyltransferase
MRLSVILPTYNERPNIVRLVERVERALQGIAHELIFVDDSTDGTDAEIAIQARQRPEVVLVHREIRSGLATAVIDGIGRVSGDVICVLDADLQHPPETIPALLEAFASTGADLVVASRNIPGGSYGAFSAARRLASRVATLIAHALLARARLVTDPMSGFFVVRTDAVRGVELKPLGYKILLEILVRGRLHRVAEVPYRFDVREAGASKLSLRQQWEYALHLLRLMTAQPDDTRFLRFCLVGGSGVVVNMGVLWALATRGVHYIAAGIAGTALAVTSNFLLNDAFTWRDRKSPSWGAKADRYWRYWVVAGASSVIQIGVLFLLTTIGIPYLVSNLIGIGTATAWNFRMNSGWTWKFPQSPLVEVVNHGVESDSRRSLLAEDVRLKATYRP